MIKRNSKGQFATGSKPTNGFTLGHKRKVGKKLSPEFKKHLSRIRQGKKLSDSTKRKISEAHKGKMPKNFKTIQKKSWEKNRERVGSKNPEWKGDEVSYSGLHKWVNKHLGQPDTCESCGKSGLGGKKIHWANKSRKYKRNLDDWLRLCAKCHVQYDSLKEDANSVQING